jgi:menaquinone-dependent protoporphyrinogen oxidase
MQDKILIAYASRTGITAGVADRIGKTLIDLGVNVDIRKMQDINDISSYRAVIAGSAIQAGKWLPEAMEFIEKNQQSLAQKPFAAFLVCMTLAMPKAAEYQLTVATWFSPVRSLVKPVSEGLFAGALNVNQISSFSERLKFRLSVLFGVWKEGDHRDWEAISNWAKSLFPLIKTNL